MKKLLGLVIMLSAALVLSIGTTGCTTKKDKDKDAAKEKTKEKEAKTKDKDTPVVKEKDKDKDKDADTKGKDYSLDVSGAPASATIKAGETKDVTLTVKRGKDATKEVVLKVEVDPKDKGVTATVDPAKVAGDKSESKVTVSSDKKAAGDYTVTVTATSEGSKETWAKVKVKVEEEAVKEKDKDAKEKDKDAKEKDKDVVGKDKDKDKEKDKEKDKDKDKEKDKDKGKDKDKDKEKASAPRLLNDLTAQLHARNESFVLVRIETPLGRRYQTISR